METIIATEIPPAGTEKEIIELFENNSQELFLDNSVIYYGFPIFKDYDNESVKSNICVLSRLHGIVIINVTNINNLITDDEELSQLFSHIDAALKKSKKLRVNKSTLALSLESFLYCSEESYHTELDNDVLNSLLSLKKFFKDRRLTSEIADDVFQESRAILEGSKALTKIIHKSKISDDPTTKINILIDLEKEISNFDAEQRKIAISLINGPQRIRGLAGSGKTVVLAMKAAHIHLQYPERKILFTFYTKSLYGIIKDS